MIIVKYFFYLKYLPGYLYFCRVYFAIVQEKISHKKSTAQSDHMIRVLKEQTNISIFEKETHSIEKYHHEKKYFFLNILSHVFFFFFFLYTISQKVHSSSPD